MNQTLGCVTFLVRDYDEAIAWFVDVLGFRLDEDSHLGEGKRWVVVAPPGSTETRLLLARAATDAQHTQVGRQAGGRVAFFLHTDDFAGDFAMLRARGVVFEEAPRHESYGTVAVFKDLYGNRWDLLEPTRSTAVGTGES